MTIAAIRYNNPGDVSLPISGWTGGGKIVGIPGQVGYAEFPSMAIGFAAFEQRLRSYIARGRDTIRKIGEVYATDPHWGLAVAELAGIGIDVRLSASASGQMSSLASAIIKQETGMTLAQLEAKK